METKIIFSDTEVVRLTESTDTTLERGDIVITTHNYSGKANENEEVTFLNLKEHEAVYLANAILQFVEQQRKSNKEWIKENPDLVYEHDRPFVKHLVPEELRKDW